MTFWQRWRFRAESRTIRADLDRLAQRLDHTEQRINDLDHRINALSKGDAVRQQSREQRAADQRVQRSWSIEPALAANGTTQIVYMRLGSRFEAHIPHNMAILLANGLTDAVETNVATTYSRRKGIHHNNTPGDK